MNNNKRIFVSDRGRAAYFHGRKLEINFFKNALKESQKEGKAHSILIQGAPGVGKTALLKKLEKIRIEYSWHIAKMEFEALWNPNEF